MEKSHFNFRFSDFQRSVWSVQSIPEACPWIRQPNNHYLSSIFSGTPMVKPVRVSSAYAPTPESGKKIALL